MDANQQQSAPGTYLSFVEQQLTGDGCTTRWEDWAGVPVLVGRRGEFRMRWMGTKLHLFTVAAAVPEITVQAISGFTDQVMKYAKDTKGGLPVGFQNGIGAFPLLVSDRVDSWNPLTRPGLWVSATMVFTISNLLTRNAKNPGQKAQRGWCEPVWLSNSHSSQEAK